MRRLGADLLLVGVVCLVLLLTVVLVVGGTGGWIVNQADSFLFPACIYGRRDVRESIKRTVFFLVCIYGRRGVRELKRGGENKCMWAV